MKVILDGGEVIDLGVTEATPTIGIVDYSRRVTDDYGVTTVVERGFARRMSVRLVVPFDQTDALQRNLAAIRAKPARWVADDRFAWLDFRGFFKDFEIDLAVPPKSYCTLTVEALTATEAFADPGGDPAPGGAASTLQLLQPITIEGAALAASNVPENDYPEWSADTTYALGARVIKAATHRIYESGALGNKGNDPAGISGKWSYVGPTNRWAMFDEALGSTTAAAGAITVTLAPGTIDSVALLDVKGATVRVQAAGYDRTAAPNASGTITFLDMPETAGQVTVTVTGAGTVEVGTLLAGQLVGLGSTTDSPKAGITDFSRKEADGFGDVQVVERAWAKRMSLQAKLRRDAIDLVAGRIAAVRAKPSLWIGKEGMETLTAYGFFKDFTIEVDATVCTLSLSIEGLSTAGKVEPLSASVDWPAVGDPLGTKPEDNATVGAPAGTDVAGVPAEDVVAQLGDLDTKYAELEAVDTAANEAISAAQADIDKAVDDIAKQGTAISTIEGAVGDNTADIELIVQQLQALDADSLAQISNKLGVMVGQNESVAGALLAAAITNSQQSAAFTSERTLRANAEEVIARSVESIGVRMGTAEAGISSEATVRAQADNALSNRVDTVTASAGANASAITAEASARANADGALSNRIDTVTATANGHTASISQQASAIAGIDGDLDTLFAQYVLSVQAGDVVGGIKLMSNGEVIDFTMQSNRFRMIPPGGNGSDGKYIVVDASGRTTDYILYQGVRVVEMGWRD